MRLFPCLRLNVAIGLCAATSLSANAAIAAEQVVFKYQALRESVSVRELSTFAATGVAPAKLEGYLKLSQNGTREFRQALTNEVTVNRTQLNQFLDSWVGNLTLDEVSQIILNRSGQSSKQALRSAIVASTAKDNKFTLLEVFQNYPTAQVEVDLDRLIETSQRINRR